MNQTTLDIETNPFNLTNNALQVCRDRYLAKENGEIVETTDQMFRRIAKAVALAEEPNLRENAEQNFFDLLSNLVFLPNSPTLMNAGKSFGMLSACFVLPIDDDLDSILSTQVDIMRIQRAGGGTGFTLDNLRASGSYIKSSGGTTSGPISFWRSYSESTHAIQQGAFRRGANMMMMSVTHPDIIKFLFAKQNLTQFENYNISVKLTDAFMFMLGENAPAIFTNPQTGKKYCMPASIVDKVKQAVEAGKQNQKYIRKIDNCYSLADLIDFPVADEKILPTLLTNEQIFDIIAKNAWQTGEPGVVFIDRIRETEPTPHIGLIGASNPCGEQFLLPHEACNLGSINVSHDRFIKVPEDKLFASKNSFNWLALRQAIYNSIRFLDNVIDVNKYPTEKIHQLCHGNRKIGLGIMGLADLFYKLGIRYNSEEGEEFFNKLMKFFNESAWEASEIIANEKGVFPNYQGSRLERKGIKARNAETTTIAPTGTISILANCSGGIEPMFSLAFERNVLDGKRLWETNSNFEKALKFSGCYSKELLKKIAKTGTIQNILEIPEEIRHVFVCAHDIAPEVHVKMQAIAQKNVSNSISKTCNLPNSAKVEDVQKIYLMAFELGCKSITVYRDKCRENQPMALIEEVKKEATNFLAVVNTPAEKKPIVIDELDDTATLLPAIRIREDTVFGHLHVKITVDPVQDRELEIFAQLGYAGSIEQADLEAICRLASLMLRAGFPITTIANQLLRINTSLSHSSSKKTTSLPKGIANALVTYLKFKAQFGLAGLLSGEHLKASKQSEPQTTKQVSPTSFEPEWYANKVSQANCTKPNTTLPIQDSEVVGYKVICPRGKYNCTGQIIREGTCQYCKECGASSC